MESLEARILETYRALYPGKDAIPLHEPSISDRERDYVRDCVDSTFVSTVGPYVTRFAKDMAAFSGAKHAVPMVNGTAALHMSLVCAGVERDDEIICPDLTFVATCAAIVHAGANPVFLDVEPDTMGLDPAILEQFLEGKTYRRNGTLRNKRTDRRIAAVVVMHNVGFPARIREIKAVCDRFELALVEDAAEALASGVDGRMCGTFGVAGVYSFNGNKIITTGGGGMLVTDSDDLAARALHLSTTAKVTHPFLYIHDDIGYNYRMPNLNAAFGAAQLERLPQMLQRKKAQARYVREALQGAELDLLEPVFGTYNYWFVICRVRGTGLNELVTSLQKGGVLARPIWSPVSRMKPYQRYESGVNGVANELARTILCLPNGISESAVPEVRGPASGAS